MLETKTSYLDTINELTELLTFQELVYLSNKLEMLINERIEQMEEETGMVNKI